MRHQHRLFGSTVSAACGFLLWALCTPASAQEANVLSIPLSDPGSAAALEVSLLRGSITVTAHDRPEVSITVEAAADNDDDDAPAVRRDGLRRIPNTGFGLTATEQNNVVSISSDFRHQIEHLSIRVPRNTSVHASGVNGGPVSIEGVNGAHELSNTNGSISATAIAGSLVANTTNGDIDVSFTELTPDMAMSFSSFNGNVDVSFPRDLSADLRISSGRGEVLTEFDVTVAPLEPTVDRSEGTGRYQVRFDREVRATVGGGGPEMYFKTFNGDIVIRDNVDD